MGPSGSGKTTLLDLMAGRKTVGSMTGSIMFAGHKGTRPFLRRFTGYVEQFGEQQCCYSLASWLAAIECIRCWCVGQAALPRLWWCAASTGLAVSPECIRLAGATGTLVHASVTGSSREPPLGSSICDQVARFAYASDSSPTAGLHSGLCSLCMCMWAQRCGRHMFLSAGPV